MAKHKEHVTLKDDLHALPFLVPFGIVFALFIGYPLFYSLWISLHQVTIFSDFYNIFGTMNYVGVDNYSMVLTDPVFWWSVLLTFAYALLTIFPGIVLSLALAVFLNRKIKGFGLLRGGFFLPNVFDIYVVGVIWLLIYNPSGGLFSWFLDVVGMDALAKQGVLNNPWLTLPAIALAMVLKNAGFGMILFLTSLNNISQSIFEAAEVDGASPAQKMIYVTLPLLKPILFFLVVTGMVNSLNAFAEIYAMTDNGGGTSVVIGGETLQSARISGYHLFRVFDQSMYGQAAAISFCLLVIAVAVSLFSFKFLSPREP